MSTQQPVQQPAADKSVEPVKPTNRVYCRWEVTDDTLKEIFGQHGKVVDARVVRGPRLRHYGFVTFETEADAAKAIEALNGKGVSSPMTLEFAASERPPRVRQPRAPRQQPLAGAMAADGTTLAESAPAAVPKPRRPRGPKIGVAAPQGAPVSQSPPAAHAEGAPRPRRRRNRHAAEQKDPNWGKVVALYPDPIRTPLPVDAKLIDLAAGPRQYRPGYTNGKVISSLILNADPNKGPFNCDFRLGDFDLKLLSVKVNSKPNDCRISARIQHVATSRSREVYLRVRPNGDNRHKFFELTKEAAPAGAELVEVFFVGVDLIQLDAVTGLWKKIVLSLVSAMVPPRVPRSALAAAAPAVVTGAVPAAAAAAPAVVKVEPTAAPTN